MLKDLRIAKKLALSNLLAGLLFFVAIAITFMTLWNTTQELQAYYSGPYQKGIAISGIQKSLHEMEKDIYEAAGVKGAASEENQENREELAARMREEAMLLKNGMASEEARTQLSRFLDLVEELEEIQQEAAAGFSAGKLEEGFRVMREAYRPVSEEASRCLDSLTNLAASLAKEEVDAVGKSAATAYFGAGGVFLMAAAALMLIQRRVSRAITKPLREIQEAARRLEEGDLSVEIDYHSHDELGVLADSVRKTAGALSDYVKSISNTLTGMADGNMAQDVKTVFRGDFEPIGQSMQRILNAMNDTLGRLRESSEQVAGGSSQMAEASQALAEGAARQAGAAEALARGVGEVEEKVQSNAHSAAEVSVAVDTTGKAIFNSNRRMQELTASMEEINRSANKIKNIIKNIDEIAFQTKILALNAAVEAARAGNAGKGFSVVAEEVRNLAAKSAAAAMDTSELIGSSILAVENGTVLAQDAAAAMNDVAEQSKYIMANVKAISRQSEEQSNAVRAIREDVERISSVVQTNSATAQQSAAASEELSGQAQMLRELAERFTLREHESNEVL